MSSRRQEKAAASNASQAAAEYARKKREAIEKAMALRKQRAVQRAAAERGGGPRSRDDIPADVGQRKALGAHNQAWWEKPEARSGPGGGGLQPGARPLTPPRQQYDGGLYGDPDSARSEVNGEQFDEATEAWLAQLRASNNGALPRKSPGEWRGWNGEPEIRDRPSPCSGGSGEPPKRVRPRWNNVDADADGGGGVGFGPPPPIRKPSPARRDPTPTRGREPASRGAARSPRSHPETRLTPSPRRVVTPRLTPSPPQRRGAITPPRPGMGIPPRSPRMSPPPPRGRSRTPPRDMRERSQTPPHDMRERSRTPPPGRRQAEAFVVEGFGGHGAEGGGGGHHGLRHGHHGNRHGHHGNRHGHRPKAHLRGVDARAQGAAPVLVVRNSPDEPPPPARPRAAAKPAAARRMDVPNDDRPIRARVDWDEWQVEGGVEGAEGVSPPSAPPPAAKRRASTASSGQPPAPRGAGKKAPAAAGAGPGGPRPKKAPPMAPHNPQVARAGDGQSAAGRALLAKQRGAPGRPRVSSARAPAPSAGVGITGAKKKAAEEDPVTRQMVDKRQSRKDNADSFKAAIARYRGGEMPPSLAKAFRRGGAVPKLGSADGGPGVPVYIRKRPLFSHETRKREYDCVTIDPSTAPDFAVIHNCMMHPDLKRMHMKHMAFPCSRGFSDLDDNDKVYAVTCKGLVSKVASGGLGALFMYGQTGSGKTFTMSALEERAVVQIFHCLPRGARVSVAVFEIAGKRCVDLLQGGQREVQLKEMDGGYVALMGALEPEVGSAEHLMDVMQDAKSRRATSSTDINATSSRSHCVTRVSIALPGRERAGSLTLVDCAGSERNADSMYHSAERRKETAEINASLYALRECLRLRRQKAAVAGQEAATGVAGRHVHVPYRSSSLTRVLMECLVDDDAELAVIATVSPTATDIEHSVSTLQTALMMSGASEGSSVEVKVDVERAGAQAPQKREIKPVNWSPEDVRQWLSRIAKGAFRGCVASLPAALDGRQLVRMTRPSLAALCGGDGNLVFNALRDEMERVDRILNKNRKEFMAAQQRQKEGW